MTITAIYGISSVHYIESHNSPADRQHYSYYESLASGPWEPEWEPRAVRCHISSCSALMWHVLVLSTSQTRHFRNDPKKCSNRSVLGTVLSFKKIKLLQISRRKSVIQHKLWWGKNFDTPCPQTFRQMSWAFSSGVHPPTTNQFLSNFPAVPQVLLTPSGRFLLFQRHSPSTLLQHLTLHCGGLEKWTYLWRCYSCSRFIRNEFSLFSL